MDSVRLFHGPQLASIEMKPPGDDAPDGGLTFRLPYPAAQLDTPVMLPPRVRFRLALLFAFGLYGAACVLPATKVWGSTNLAGGGKDVYVERIGLVCLVMGLVFLPDAVEQGSTLVAWLANPLAFIGLLLSLVRRPVGAVVFGVVSVLVGALYVIAPPGRPEPDLPQIGAWVWLGSLLALTATAFIRREQPPANEPAAANP